MQYLRRVLKNLYVIPLLLVASLAGCQSQTMTAADKTNLLRSAALEGFGVNLKKEEFTKYETFSKTGYYDSTYDLDYEFETPDNSSWPLYINQSLSVHDSPGEAMAGITTLRGGATLAMKSRSVSEKSVPNEKIYGDGSKLSLLVDEKGAIHGNLFSARKGRRSYYIVLSGIYFETADDWEDFAGDNIRNWLDKKVESE